MLFFGIKVYLCVLTSAVAIAPNTLRMVNVLYRHGDRSPVTTYPKDPYQESIWPQGFGWLTTIGMQEEYELGQFLRSEYKNFLNETYKNSEIYVESSDENRCLMSAYSNLAGLYPPTGDQIWNPNITWQPIPVHTRPKTEDNKLNLGAPCPRYDQLYAQEMNAPDVKKEEKENAAFYELVESHTGVSKENITEIWKIGDALFCEKTHNLTLPSWTQQLYDDDTVYNRLLQLQAFSFDLLYRGRDLSRLKGGPLLKEMELNMQAYIANPSNTSKMFMYSAFTILEPVDDIFPDCNYLTNRSVVMNITAATGRGAEPASPPGWVGVGQISRDAKITPNGQDHDSTIAAVTNAMQVFNLKSPPYASTVFLELHEINSAYFVQIRYRNDSRHDPYILIHPDCAIAMCPLQTFLDVTKDRIPVDWNAECQVQSHDFLSGSVLALIAVCGVLVALLIIQTVACLRYRHTVNKFQMLP